jgi:hypothetical protein
MTSYDPREDQSCVLLKGEHPACVIPRTCITYSRGNAKASNAELDALVAAGRIQLLEPVSPDLLKRIREGAILSTRMPKELKAILIEQGLAAGPATENDRDRRAGNQPQ